MNKTTSLWRFANPLVFTRVADTVLPVLWIVSLSCLAVGLLWGFAFTPVDFRQGSTVKIIFLHVPAAIMAVNVWLMMLVASLIWFIRRHHVSALAAKAAAPVGLTMAMTAILTGAIWGQPMWGTWWAWDPRLTSFFILLICYVGYISLWNAIEDPGWVADATAALCLFGSVFALLSRYAVNFWSQGLHQGATLSLDADTNIDNIYYFPLLLCLAGYGILCVALILYRTRTEIRKRRIMQLIDAEGKAWS